MSDQKTTKRRAYRGYRAEFPSRRPNKSGPGKTRGVRAVWWEHPTGSRKGRARCECHHAYPCPREK